MFVFLIIFFMLTFTISFIVPSLLIYLPFAIKLNTISVATIICKPTDHQIHAIVQNSPPIFMSIGCHLAFVYMTIRIHYSNYAIGISFCVSLTNESQITSCSFSSLIFIPEAMLTLNKELILQQPINIQFLMMSNSLIDLFLSFLF